MKIIHKIPVTIIILLLSFSCKEYDSHLLPENIFRVKTIIEVNEYGDDEKIHNFTYENDKLILWTTFYKNETEDLLRIKKVSVSYKDNTIFVMQSLLVNNKWEEQQECKFIIQNNLIREKLVSRHRFPACSDCWKYSYTYIGSKLNECKKFSKSSSGDWELIEKQAYAYQNNNLVKYEDFIVNQDGELVLDYVRNYFLENEEPTGWEGGTFASSREWYPTQKMEYIYEQDLMFSLLYSVWDASNNSWKLFGTTSYSYDANNNLIDELTSTGKSIHYVYEAGKGNAALIYCDPLESSSPEPKMKSILAKTQISLE